jgi:hypothetical protein
MNPKYICIDSYIGGPKYFIFPNHIEHSEFAKKLLGEKDKVISAGFIKIYDNEFHPYGSSFTLNVSCSKDDKRMMNLQFGIKIDD